MEHVDGTAVNFMKYYVGIFVIHYPDTILDCLIVNNRTNNSKIKNFCGEKLHNFLQSKYPSYVCIYIYIHDFPLLLLSP